MNKGQWVILGIVGLALVTSAAYINIQTNASPTPPAAPEAPAAPAAPAAPEAPTPPTPPAVPATPAQPGANATISESAARAIAVRTLMGDPYGKTEAEVLRNITATSFSNENGEAQWVFEIRVAGYPDLPEGISGQFRVNAKDGSIEPRGLPFLD